MLFYVYALARPVKKDWRIFYIGKGSKRRVWRHESEARRGCRCHKCNIIRKVWREGGEIQRYILLTTEDEQTAFAYEKEMIAMHGRENLTNLTDGGEGPSGRSQSKEERERRGFIMRTALANPITGTAIRRGLAMRWVNNNARMRQAQNTKGRWEDGEERARLSERVKAVRSTPESRAKTSAASKAGWENPETRQRRTAGVKAARNTPESKAKTSAASKAMYTPERRAEYSKAITKRNADPAYRKAQSDKLKAYLADPEIRAKRIEQMRALVAAQKEKRKQNKAEAMRINNEQPNPDSDDDGSPPNKRGVP
jgi:hypothetical protein